MKKVLSVLLALVMMLSLSVVAFADDVIDTEAELQAALNAGGTVVLGGDVTVVNGLVVPTGVTVTLDLAGHTISQTKACTSHYSMITNNGSLTITGNGTISFTDNGAGDPAFGWGSYTIQSSGTLVVENGTIEHLGQHNLNGSPAKHMYCAIQQFNGTVTIKGGTISTPTYRSLRINRGTCYIEGGTFEGQVWVQPNQGDVSLKISGGSFAPASNIDGSSVFMTNQGAGHDIVDSEISGGEFETKIGATAPDALANVITGGEFTQNAIDSTNKALLKEDCVIVVDGTPMVKNNSGTLEETTAPATSIALDVTALSLTEGETAQLVATVEPSYTTDVIAWASSDEAIATVDQNGNVTAVAKGSAVITATAGDVSASCDVTVDCDHEIVKACDVDFHVDYCTKCEIELGEREPHEFGKWTVTKEPTKIHKGERVRVCEICDYEEVETLSRVSGEDEGHLVIPESQKPAEDKDTGKANPATGSTEFVNVAIALGTVSLAAAAAVVLKK